MKLYAALCLGAFALTPAVSLKLSDSFKEELEGNQSNSSPDSSSPALSAGALDGSTQQSSSGSNLESYAGKTAWDAATEAQVFADAAAAAAEADQPDIAQRFADAAAAAADEAAALAMSAEEKGKPEGDRKEDANLAIFAPRNFRFVDAAGGRVLNVYFHNAFDGVPAPKVEGGELKSVVVDLMRELAIDPKPLLEALEAAGATDAESLCGLAQELASEVLATERNIQTPDTKLYSQNLIAEIGGVEGLLESSLGFVAGGGQEPTALGIPRVISARPHNQLSTEETKPATASALRATGATPGNERIRIGINGFGRIGRLVFRIASKRPDMAVTHINSSMSPEYIAYMLKYDSAHGRFPGDVDVRDGSLYVNGRRIHLTASRDPTEINWQESGTDFVCESTGAFCTLKDAGKHVDRIGGARHAVISAPAKDEATPTLVVGVNAETEYKPEMRVVSCASCTTNGLAPLVKVIDSHFGIEEGLMTTVHAVTGTQRVVDMSSNKDWRGGRAAGFNIIPSATGAAKAVARCLPQMKGKLTGMAFRVPTIDVSVVDLTCRLKKSTSYEEIKAAVKAAAEGEMRGILGYTEEAVVSSDIMGSECSSVFDASAGIMLNPNFVKLVSWYDNEFAYSARLVDLIAIMAAKDGLVPEGTGLARKPF